MDSLRVVALIATLAACARDPGVDADDGFTPGNLPRDIEVCAAPAPGESPWNIEYPTLTSVRYTCKETCPVQDGTGCLYATDDSHFEPATNTLEHPHQLTTLAYVIKDMGGELRWNTPPTIAATLLDACGGTGTFFSSEKADIAAARDGSGSLPTRVLWEQLIEASGILLVESRWDLGAKGIPGSSVGTQGWFSRNDDTGHALPWAVERPAAVLAFVRMHLAGTTKLGTAGCSGGSIQTFAPVLWYGLDRMIDYQYFSGPLPAAWDVPATCGVTTPARGVCENDPSRSCMVDAVCGVGFHCAMPEPTGTLDEPLDPLGEVVKSRIVDYGCHSGADCVRGIANPCFAASSMDPSVEGSPVGDFAFTHVVDVNVGIGGSPTIMTDTNLGVTFNGASMFEQLAPTCGTAPCKTYSFVTGGIHCSAFAAANLPATLATIRSGLGVP